MSLIDTPFKRVAVDIVGPIEPMIDRKNRYISTMVDYATRYPETIALPSIETERVAEAVVNMYSRLDCGSQFTSQVMNEVNRLLSIRQLKTTPYHTMCNGLDEKFNGSLKQMLKRMCSERPKDLDKY
jgi:IS30 family transposase